MRYTDEEAQNELENMSSEIAGCEDDAQSVLNFAKNGTPAVTELADGTKVFRTTSAGLGCHKLGCGMRVFVKDGKIEKVEGDPENPITNGRLCIRCLTAKEYVYHPGRLLHPMKRTRENRGLDKWTQCSWDEAYDLIMSNYKRIRDTYGINSISAWNGTGRECSQYHFTFTNDVFGSVNAVHPNSGWSCLVPRMAAMLWTMGSSYIEADNSIGLPQRYDDPRWECPKYMLIWGRDPLRSNPDGLFGHSIIDMMKRGMKLIVADPRANWLATRAEVHLQLRPGTDGALAMALINVVINEDLYDHEFVDSWTYGFEQLAERVNDPVLGMTPERAGEICDIDSEDIRYTARCLAERPSALSMGLAVDQNPNTMQIGHALLSLFAILGDMDIPGGCFMGQPPTFSGMAEVGPASAADSAEPEGLALYGNTGVEPLGHDRFPAMSRIVNTTHPDCTLDVLETGQPYPLKFAYMFCFNGIANMVPQQKRWMEAIRKMEFVAVADLFMTPLIMACADVVLPAASMFEHDAHITNSNASQPGQLGMNEKCIAPLGECKSDLQIMIDIHRLIYPNSKKPEWQSAEAFIDNEIQKIGGIETSFSELKEKVIGQFELPYKKYEKGLLRGDSQPGFNTPTGRIELYSTILQSLGDDPLPYYIEPKFSPISRPDLIESYPLILTSGARRFTSFHSENRQIKTLREIHEWPTLQINPITAQKYGISDGMWVKVENQLGSAKLKAETTPIVKENVVSADHGWWLPESDPEKLFGCLEYNINALIPHEENGPLGFGTHYKSMPCKVSPADSGPDSPDPLGPDAYKASCELKMVPEA